LSSASRNWDCGSTYCTNNTISKITGTRRYKKQRNACRTEEAAVVYLLLLTACTSFNYYLQFYNVLALIPSNHVSITSPISKVIILMNNVKKSYLTSHNINSHTHVQFPNSIRFGKGIPHLSGSIEYNQLTLLGFDDRTTMHL
jgi:hypothetical protein